MNAPIRTQAETVEQRLLLAANQQLESVFQRDSDPCVALLISRNYHLLIQQYPSLSARLSWVQKAKYWWQQYLNLSTGKRKKMMPNIHYEEWLFKRIDTVA
tara:strand:+ start:354 stop:656 length:303 start_codon:yes stop_codon:yes gene_type:complete